MAKTDSENCVDNSGCLTETKRGNRQTEVCELGRGNLTQIEPSSAILHDQLVRKRLRQ